MNGNHPRSFTDRPRSADLRTELPAPELYRPEPGDPPSPTCGTRTAPGLWDDSDRDACGIGFVADIGGRRSHRIPAMALEALAHLAHRGAVAADGKTSDGTGVLTQIPWMLLRHELGLGSAWHDADLAAAMLFLPPGEGELRLCRSRVEEVLDATGIELLAWRRVPVREEVLGEQARATCPAIFQAVLGRRHPADGGVERGDAFERRLLLARKRLESRARAEGLEDLVVVSMSHRTMVYKSMAMAEELGDFYPDLRNPAFRSSVALFHQRFSTNTWPTWRLAQPFRMLAHNGEINTIQGNLHWMRTREPQLESELWGDELEELFPVLDERASDSAMLDQMLEMLVLSGRSPLHAMMMLIPEASRKTSEKLPELRAFYEYHSMLLEPWDGPAAVVFTDGRLAAAALDRNGLRPQRYWRTRDGLLILGSEAGMVGVPEGSVVEKGRLGPGEMLAVDMEAGRVLRNSEIKLAMATRQPYGRWVREQMVPPPEAAPLAADPADGASEIGAGGEGAAETSDAGLERRQKAFGYTKEALERIFDPMLTEAKLPVGSMGNDAPLAVLSRQPQLLYSYFKQRFAQVTNPPIDPIRERLVFSLESFAGGWANLLEEKPETAHLVRFTSPVL
ncbi:MAG: hypothetical protein MI919_11280, partial [Holophagales bacterium]|nr:hypothetical protein [Holophagales bacterium]